MWAGSVAGVEPTLQSLRDTLGFQCSEPRR
jgi:hypothetical protein